MLDITDSASLPEWEEGPEAATRPVILLPWLGEISPFARLSMRMLARRAGEVELILVCDRPTADIPGIRQADFASAFDAANPLGITFAGLKANPYKICDLKPFLNLLFPSLPGAGRRWGWADIDCLYSDRLLQPLALPQAGPPQVFGKHGHLMLGDFEGFRLAQQVLFEVDRRYPHWRMFAADRHLALDEFLFLHVVLRVLDEEGSIAWRRNFPPSIGDVEPYHRLPLVGDRWFRYFRLRDHRLFGIAEDGGETEFDYIHLQKRRIAFDPALTGNEEALLYPLRDGSMRLVEAGAQETPPGAASAFRDLRYFLAVNRKRLTHRLRNHGFAARPEVSPETVRDILQKIG
ncbi:DUF6625 family protein [Afifella sp. IM 167]|uniref:DUF6625 family protein n=1 Tax=Afifella sp. IM 167 TaxID=2033586 RepID=UPI001CCC6BE8|nr:DUF6625 family protein [Afifella sp. IM 167]MBZ8132151.1 hypothetical protein [Afifella sp. IM 167]